METIQANFYYPKPEQTTASTSLLGCFFIDFGGVIYGNYALGC
jgi:hypothetical protein